jgi:hypothetical protein
VVVGSRAQRRPGAAALIENGALVVAASVGLAAITVAVDVWDSARGWLLAGNAKGIATVAQVVPATVVAVFVFALGAVFVVAQILIPSRGARSISVLLRYVRTRLVLAAGVVLLVGSLLIVPGGPPEHLEHWRAELAAALLVAAGLYIVAATLFLAWTLQGQISPRTFKDRLVKKPRPWGLAPRRSAWWG